MKRLFLILALLFAAAPAYAQTELSPLLSTQNADNVTLYAGRQVYPAGAMHPMGVLFTTTATKGTATGTSEQTLATFSLPASALDQPGRRIRITAMFSKAANVDAVTGKIYFGSETISTGSNTTSGAGMFLSLEVVKSGSSTQIVWGNGQSGTTNVTPYSAAGAETDTSPITIKATCTDGTSAANDCVLQDFYVEYMN